MWSKSLLNFPLEIQQAPNSTNSVHEPKWFIYRQEESHYEFMITETCSVNDLFWYIKRVIWCISSQTRLAPLKNVIHDWFLLLDQKIRAHSCSQCNKIYWCWIDCSNSNYIRCEKEAFPKPHSEFWLNNLGLMAALMNLSTDFQTQLTVGPYQQ